MKDVDLNGAIADLLKMIRRVIGEHITLDFVSNQDGGIIRADRGQIEQILMNLCVNARDAMPEGGRLTIETESVEIGQGFCQSHPWAKPGRYALISVTDTGCGIDEEYLETIFDPFFTTKGVGEGTGLGLSTVYGLVRQHGGLIHVYSEVDKGTTFKIYLPQLGRSATILGEQKVDVAPAGSETILLAEDDDVVRKLSKAFLTRAGYHVLVANNGEEALAVFEEHADEIDLVLLDVVMPKLGGRAVFERIRQTHPHIRTLFASGYSMSAIHTNFVLEEGFALIQKPYERKVLLRKVREVLDGDREDRE
jgi:CheY-like chemotaxis protein